MEEQNEKATEDDAVGEGRRRVHHFRAQGIVW